MTDSGSRRGAANLAPILMILSFAAMAGLLWWLGMTAEGTEPVVMEEPEVDSVEMMGMPVTVEQLRTQPDSLVGQFVRVAEAPVALATGPNAFLMDVGEPGRSTYILVVFDSTLVAEGRTVPQGQATVVGTVGVRTDSILDAFVASGLIPEEQRGTADFADHYIQAIRVRAAGQPPGAGGPGGGGGDGADGSDDAAGSGQASRSDRES